MAPRPDTLDAEPPISPDPISPRPRVLVTRAQGQSSALAERLRELGAEPVLIPALEIVASSSFAALDDAISRLMSPQRSLAKEPAFHWLLFTSANAVEAFSRRVPHLREAKVGYEPRTPRATPKVAAIGLATAWALVRVGIVASVDDVLLPPHAVAESLTTALLPHALQPTGTPIRFLLVRAEEAREALPEALRAAGAEVTVAPAYRTVIPETSIAAIRDLFAGTAGVDAVTFTSSSSVRNLLALCAAAGVSLPPSAPRVSIGPITSQTLRDAGLPPHAESSEANVKALAEATMRALSEALG